MALQRDKVVNNAEKLVAKGKIEPAIREYERLLDENPNDVNTLNRIGDLWVRIERNDEAVKVFRKIADHYAKDGFFLKAIAIYKKINKLDPSKLDIYAKLAELYAKQGLAMEAKSQYMVLADYYIKHGDSESALNIYKKIAELDPNSVNVHIKLADLYSQTHNTAEALQEYDRVGRMLLKRGMSVEAVQVFRKALKIDSGNVDLAESLVTALLEEKDYDNAIQILQTALESNRENPRLIVLVGKTQLAKGDANGARDALEQGLSSNPSDVGIREALAELYLRQEDPDRALDLVAPLVTLAINKSDGRTALSFLNHILKSHPEHIGSLERLVAAYTELKEGSNVNEAMNRLAEAHISQGRHEDAEPILRELIRREPENLQTRDKLAFVQQTTGTASYAEETPPAVTTAEPEELLTPDELLEEEPEAELEEERTQPHVAVTPQAPAPAEETPVDDEILTPTAEIETESPEELEEEIEIEIEEDLPKVDETPQPAPAFSQASPISSAALDRERARTSEDLDFITEHVTEAEVFAKYGLAEKAVEHLMAVINRIPDHLPAYEKLLAVYMTEGESDKVAQTATQYVSRLRSSGDFEKADSVEQEVWTRGFAIFDEEESQRKAAIPAPPPEVPATSQPSVQQPETAELPPELEIKLAEVPDVLPDELAPQSLSTPEELEDIVPDLDFDFGDLPLEEEMNIIEATAAPLPEETLPPKISVEEEIAPEPGVDMFFGVEAEKDFGELETDDMEIEIEGPTIEDLGELDFYIDQELFEEARGKFDSLSAQFPNHPEMLRRAEKLHSIPEQHASFPASSTPSLMEEPVLTDREVISDLLSSADLERDLVFTLPEEQEPEEDVEKDREEVEVARETVSSTASRIAVSEPAEEEDLFAAEDDFFDLAAELEEELEGELDQMPTASEEEQSLEQIFKEFKKGVEQQLDSEDYDTHYNLGIAYKEMGLIDEAIGEFQLASKDPKRAIDGCSMLGLCFLEKGMPQLAIKWYTKGLEMPEISEEENLGLLYDLGHAYLEVGDTENAHKTYLEVFGINSKYRDISGRLKQLEDARRIQ